MLLNREGSNNIYYNLSAYNYNEIILHQINSIPLRIFKLRVFLKSETDNSNLKIYI